MNTRLIVSAFTDSLDIQIRIVYGRSGKANLTIINSQFPPIGGVTAFINRYFTITQQ